MSRFITHPSPRRSQLVLFIITLFSRRLAGGWRFGMEQQRQQATAAASSAATAAASRSQQKLVHYSLPF